MSLEVSTRAGGVTHVCMSPLFGSSCESHAGHPSKWCVSCITRLKAERDEARECAENVRWILESVHDGEVHPDLVVIESLPWEPK